jgi:hypothetical protein
MTVNRYFGDIVLKNYDAIVLLVRRVAELAYVKHGVLGNTDALGPITGIRLPKFLDGSWRKAMVQVYGCGRVARGVCEVRNQTSTGSRHPQSASNCCPISTGRRIPTCCWIP